MNETIEFCSALRQAAKDQRQTWLATVIGVEGAAYRRPGARMLFDRDGVLAGGVSAGRLEADLVRRGAWLTRRGPGIKTYAASLENEDGLGHGCAGTVNILVAPLTADIERCFFELEDALGHEQRTALITVVQSSDPELPVASHLCCALRTAGSARRPRALTQSPRIQELLRQAQCVLHEGKQRPAHLHFEGFEALVQSMEPEPHLFIFGAGTDALPVAQMAKLLGWNVSVCTAAKQPTIGDRLAGKARLLQMTGEEAAALGEQCARPLALLMAHDYELDRENLDALLATRIPYIGVLGPAERTDRMLAELQQRGRHLSDSDLERVHGPAGLSLDAETPTEVALSVLSQAHALIARTQVVALKDCIESIAAPPFRPMRPQHVGRV